MKTMAQRIKYYRNKKGLTQEAVADHLGIRTSNYARYESGERKPKDEKIIAMANFFDVSYDAIRTGIEREFAALLYRHAVSATLGEVDVFNSFLCDMDNSSEAYDVIRTFLDKGDENFKRHDKVYYEQFIETPDIKSLSSLYELYKNQLMSCINAEGCDAENEEGDVKEPNGYPSLGAETTTKWAFCVGAHNYLLNTNTEDIIREVENYSGNIEPLQFFAVKVFVPFISFIAETVEFCENTSIDDFEIAFLFDALTPPADEELDEDDEDE